MDPVKLPGVISSMIVSVNASPADVTWKAGVDVLCFGATKGGAMAAEAGVFFDRALAANMAERRKRAGHLVSKHRFLALQFSAFLKDDCWLRLARLSPWMGGNDRASWTTQARVYSLRLRRTW